ncbi:MAG: RDD family protein [Rubrivivax sp.]|nr:RDD family protein [Rubrivivax sp.]
MPLVAKASPLRRRLICMVYEGVLLFGVVVLAGLLFAGFTQQRHALQGQWGLRALLFLVLGAYFVGFWSRRGQTLAMKTWHIELRSRSGALPSSAQACARYLLSWLWFMPALGIAWAANLRSGWEVAGVVMAGVAGYAALTLLHPTRQFFHDVLCGTQLIDTRPSAATPHHGAAAPTPPP